jgi:hypothetical protein
MVATRTQEEVVREVRLPDGSIMRIMRRETFDRAVEAANAKLREVIQQNRENLR